MSEITRAAYRAPTTAKVEAWIRLLDATLSKRKLSRSRDINLQKLKTLLMSTRLMLGVLETSARSGATQVDLLELVFGSSESLLETRREASGELTESSSLFAHWRASKEQVAIVHQKFGLSDEHGFGSKVQSAVNFVADQSRYKRDELWAITYYRKERRKDIPVLPAA